MEGEAGSGSSRQQGPVRPLPLFRRGLGVVVDWRQSLLPTQFVILIAGAFRRL